MKFEHGFTFNTANFANYMKSEEMRDREMTLFLASVMLKFGVRELTLTKSDVMPVIRDIDLRVETVTNIDGSVTYRVKREVTLDVLPSKKTLVLPAVKEEG